MFSVVLVCLFICLLATLLKKLFTDCDEILWMNLNSNRNKWLKFGGDLENDPALAEIWTLLIL